MSEATSTIKLFPQHIDNLNLVVLRHLLKILMSSKLPAFVSAHLAHRPVGFKSYLVQGGSSRHSSSTDALHQGAFNVRGGDAEVVDHESYDPDIKAESNSDPAVSGSSEQKKTLQSQTATNKSRRKSFHSRDAFDGPSSKKSRSYQEQLPAGEDDSTEGDSDVSVNQDVVDHSGSRGRKFFPKPQHSTSVSTSSKFNKQRRDAQQQQISQSDDWSSQSSTSSEESSSASDSEHDRLSDPAPASKSRNSPVTPFAATNLAAKRVIYFRVKSRMSQESLEEIKQALQAYLPDVEVMLETATSLTVPYPDRESLNTLLSQILNGEISEVLVADSNHVCSTKDGFKLFSWLCQQFDTKLFILPALQNL